MKDVDAGDAQLRRLQSDVDAELRQVESSQDPADVPEPDVADYETRLHSLRDAVVVMETYEARPGQA
ncbi:MAG: hypothetical protein ABWZ91_03580 [Nocardioides sp.]